MGWRKGLRRLGSLRLLTACSHVDHFCREGGGGTPRHRPRAQMVRSAGLAKPDTMLMAAAHGLLHIFQQWPPPRHQWRRLFWGLIWCSCCGFAFSHGAVRECM